VHFGVSTAAPAWPELLPSYAVRTEWPEWKVQFLGQNRAWSWLLATALANIGELSWYRDWLDRLYEMPASFQKFEWNCRGEKLDLWSHILQLRPSGLRVKRFVHVPALVALTTTQVPIVPLIGNVDPLPYGARGRFLLAEEAAPLQGFPPGWGVPGTRTRAFRALGNAVHAGLVSRIMNEWLGR
jgi:DNA (cytosine-5)-methyltransferase 1